MISLVNCNHQMLPSAKISIPCLECPVSILLLQEGALPGPATDQFYATDVPYWIPNLRDGAAPCLTASCWRWFAPETELHTTFRSWSRIPVEGIAAVE